MAEEVDREIKDNITAEYLKKEYKKEVKKVWSLFWGVLIIAVLVFIATFITTCHQNKNTKETIKKYKNDLQANINNFPVKVYINKAGDFENEKLNGKPRSEVILEKAESYYSTKYSDLITTISTLVCLFGVGFPVALYIIQTVNNNIERKNFKEDIKEEKDRIYDNINKWVKDRTNELAELKNEIDNAKNEMDNQKSTITKQQEKFVIFEKDVSQNIAILNILLVEKLLDELEMPKTPMIIPHEYSWLFLRLYDAIKETEDILSEIKNPVTKLEYISNRIIGKILTKCHLLYTDLDKIMGLKDDEYEVGGLWALLWEADYTTKKIDLKKLLNLDFIYGRKEDDIKKLIKEVDEINDKIEDLQMTHSPD